MAIIIFIAGLLFSIDCNAASIPEPHPDENGREDLTEYDRLLSDGIEAFYSTNWNKAEKIFGNLQRMDKNDPRAYFLNSLMPFWAYFFAGEQTKHAARFLELSEKAIALSVQQLHKNASDTNMVLMLSALHGYRSLVAASEKDYRTAFKSGMDGFKYTRQILSLDSEDPRALIGKGIFMYMLGSIPSHLKWFTNMSGLYGDMQEGVEKLKLAAESDSYVSTDARMILYYLFEREKRYENALEQIEILAKKFPDNIIFQYKLAYCRDKLGFRQEARVAYNTVLKLDNTGFSVLKSQSESRLNAIQF